MILVIMILLCVNLRQKEWIHSFQETQLLRRSPNVDSRGHHDPIHHSRGCGIVAGRADVRDDAPVLCHLSSYRLAYAKMWREAVEAVLVPGQWEWQVHGFMDLAAGDSKKCVRSKVRPQKGHQNYDLAKTDSLWLTYDWHWLTYDLTHQSLS